MNGAYYDTALFLGLDIIFYICSIFLCFLTFCAFFFLQYKPAQRINMRFATSIGESAHNSLRTAGQIVVKFEDGEFYCYVHQFQFC